MNVQRKPYMILEEVCMFNIIKYPIKGVLFFLCQKQNKKRNITYTTKEGNQQ
jgi:hypothetical protein